MSTKKSQIRFSFRLRKLNGGSDKYGNCEVCNRHFDTGYLLVKQRVYYSALKKAESLTHHGCNDTFGHKDCVAKLTEN